MTLPPRALNGRFIPKTSTKTPVKVLSNQDSDYCLVLKSVNKDMSSHHDEGFFYPKKGMVEDRFWQPTRSCGEGLHGFLWGCGDSGLATWTNSKWLVLKVLKKDIIVLDYGEKVKFPRGEVIYVGNIKGATDLITAHPEGANKLVMGCTRIVGNNEIAVGGSKCKLTGGIGATLKAEFSSKLIAGHGSMLQAKNNSTFVAGNHSTIVAGAYSKVKTGSLSKVITKHKCDIETGSDSIVQADFDSSVKAGIGSIITLIDKTNKPHTFVVGENGIRVNTRYKWDKYSNSLVIV